MTRVDARAWIISIVLISGTDARHPQPPTQYCAGAMGGNLDAYEFKELERAVPWKLESGAVESRN